MLKAWRIMKAKHAANPFDGEGARLYTAAGGQTRAFD